MGGGMSAQGGLAARAAAGAGVGDQGAGQVKAAKPYEEEPIPTPTSAEIQRVGSWGKAAYDNTKPGARGVLTHSLGDSAQSDAMHAARRAGGRGGERGEDVAG